MKRLITLVFEKLHIKVSEEKIEILAQFIKFGLVGLSNTLLSYAIYLLTLLILSPLKLSWDYFVASVLSFVLSVLWSYFWNNRFVFKQDSKKRSFWKSLFKTYLSYAFTGIILGNILLYVWVALLGIPKTLAPLLSLVITVPLNFLLNKYWAFH